MSKARTEQVRFSQLFLPRLVPLPRSSRAGPGHKQPKLLAGETGYFNCLGALIQHLANCLWCCKAGLPMSQTPFLLLHLLSFSRGRMMAGDQQDSLLSPALFPCICAWPDISCSEIFVLQSDISETVTLSERHCCAHFGVTWRILLRT